jgi:tetratricopeptide (TPR) repeat protein
MAAGDIRIEQARQKCKSLREKLEASPGDAAIVQQLRVADKARLEIEAAEFRERAEKYPTNRPIRFDFGAVLFELGRIEEAMECFQASKDEPRLRVKAAHYLGKCFAASGWHDEAVLEYKEALKAIDVPDADLEQAIRYDLMLSLIEQAKLGRSMDVAKEAKDIASAIMRKSVSYRDIRDKRNEIEELIRSLSS